jgi:transposase
MTLMEKVKAALKKGLKPEEIAPILQCSVELIRKVQDRMKENGEL